MQKGQMKDSHLIEQCEQNMKSSLKNPVTRVQKVEVLKLEMAPNSSAIFFWHNSKCLETILGQETSWFLEDWTASLTFCYSKGSIYTLCSQAQKKICSPQSIINLRSIENTALWKQWRQSSGSIQEKVVDFHLCTFQV